MSGARERILARIRNSLNRDRLGPEVERGLCARITAHCRNLIPARAAELDHQQQIELFVAMAEEVQASVARVGSLVAVPEAVANYLAAENLPADLLVAPDPGLDAIPWETRPLLRIRRGRAEGEDKVSFTPCYAAIAETGTLMLISGPQTPTTLNFLPDTHIVLVHETQVVASYEDAWDRLRTDPKAEVLPRVINFITGPSRTADIEQHIELGAHGPRRLYIVLVDNDQATRSEHEQHDALTN